MTGRDAVRAMRDNGALSQRPPTPGWVRTGLLSVAMLAMAGAAFYGVTYFLGSARPSISALPTLEDGGPSFGNIGKTYAPLSDADGQSAAKVAGLSKAERNNCDMTASKAYLAYSQGPGDSSAVHDFGTPAGVIVMASNMLSCMATTRPRHLCNPDDAYTFVNAAVGTLMNYRETMAKLSGMSDDDLNALRAKDPVYGKIPLNALKADLADISRSVEAARSKVMAAFSRASTQGYLRMEIALAGKQVYDTGILNSLLEAGPPGPNACAA